MTTLPAQTPLYDWHAAHGGKLVDFAGWSMPVQYTGIVAEHLATRSTVTLFDVSHMGRLRFHGDPSAVVAALDRLVTRRVTDLKPGRIRYGLVTRHDGGILDDVLVYHLPARDGTAPYYQMVVNAGNREKIVAWFEQHLQTNDVRLEDQTDQTAMIAVQGPNGVELAEQLLDVDLAAMKYYTGCEATVEGVAGLVSRTGYTGEDGCELIVPADQAVKVWQALLSHGETLGAQAAGLGCRDTLRLEAAMPLYGHELTEEINPIAAGLSFAVNTEGREFIGRDAIAEAEQTPPSRVRVGLELSSRRVPREHYGVVLGEQTVGEVTSGTFSPTFERPIAMAYVDRAHAEIGAELAVDVRGKAEPARVVKLPFYKREK